MLERMDTTTGRGKPTPAVQDDTDVPVAVGVNLVLLAATGQEYFGGPDYSQPAVSPQDLRSLKPAGPRLYARFLRKFVDAGGTITDTHDGPIGEAILTTDRSISVPRIIGGAALNVLVPEGVTATRVGFNSPDDGITYDMADSTFTADRKSSVPLYRDVAQIMLDEGWTPECDHFAHHLKRDLLNSHANPSDKPVAATGHIRAVFARTASYRPNCQRIGFLINPGDWDEWHVGAFLEKPWIWRRGVTSKVAARTGPKSKP